MSELLLLIQIPFVFSSYKRKELINALRDYLTFYKTGALFGKQKRLLVNFPALFN